MKNFFTKKPVALVLLLVATVALAAGFDRIPNNTLKLGSGASSNKVIEFDAGNSPNAQIRWNQTAGLLQFSNDGTIFEGFNRQLGKYVAKSANYVVLDTDNYGLIASAAPSTSFTFVDADVSTSNETITETAHGLSDGDVVSLDTTLSLPLGLSALRPYYVVSSAANTIKLATTPGGSAVDITGAARGGTHTVYKGLVITLPTAADNANRVITVKKTDSNLNFVVIEGEGSETIDGQLNIALRGQYAAVDLLCDGTNWQILNSNEAYNRPIEYHIENDATSNNGIFYNGVELKATATSWFTNVGYFLPYQDASGKWRLRFNLSGNFSTGSAASFNIAIAGVTFKNTTNAKQAVAVYDHGGSNLRAVAGQATENTGNIFFRMTGSVTVDNTWTASGDVRLESKPTWAY